MRTPLHRPRSVSAYRLMWWLCLALLMPAAQAAATWHAVSHTNAASTDPGALHPASHCDLCLAGAAVSGGALAGTPQALPLDAARHAAPQARFASLWLAPTARPYHSRAPPAAALS